MRSPIPRDRLLTSTNEAIVSLIEGAVGAQVLKMPRAYDKGMPSIVRDYVTASGTIAFTDKSLIDFLKEHFPGEALNIENAKNDPDEFNRWISEHVSEIETKIRDLGLFQIRSSNLFNQPEHKNIIKWLFGAAITLEAVNDINNIDEQQISDSLDLCEFKLICDTSQDTWVLFKKDAYGNLTKVEITDHDLLAELKNIDINNVDFDKNLDLKKKLIAKYPHCFPEGELADILGVAHHDSPESLKNCFTIAAWFTEIKNKTVNPELKLLQLLADYSQFNIPSLVKNAIGGHYQEAVSVDSKADITMANGIFQIQSKTNNFRIGVQQSRLTGEVAATFQGTDDRIELVSLKPSNRVVEQVLMTENVIGTLAENIAAAEYQESQEFNNAYSYWKNGEIHFNDQFMLQWVSQLENEKITLKRFFDDAWLDEPHKDRRNKYSESNIEDQYSQQLQNFLQGINQPADRIKYLNLLRLQNVSEVLKRPYEHAKYLCPKTGKPQVDNLNGALSFYQAEQQYVQFQTRNNQVYAVLDIKNLIYKKALDDGSYSEIKIPGTAKIEYELTDQGYVERSRVVSNAVLAGILAGSFEGPIDKAINFAESIETIRAKEKGILHNRNKYFDLDAKFNRSAAELEETEHPYLAALQDRQWRLRDQNNIDPNSAFNAWQAPPGIIFGDQESIEDFLAANPLADDAAKRSHFVAQKQKFFDVDEPGLSIPNSLPNNFEIHWGEGISNILFKNVYYDVSGKIVVAQNNAAWSVDSDRFLRVFKKAGDDSLYVEELYYNIRLKNTAKDQVKFLPGYARAEYKLYPNAGYKLEKIQASNHVLDEMLSGKSIGTIERVIQAAYFHESQVIDGENYDARKKQALIAEFHRLHQEFMSFVNQIPEGYSDKTLSKIAYHLRRSVLPGFPGASSNVVEQIKSDIKSDAINIAEKSMALVNRPDTTLDEIRLLTDHVTATHELLKSENPAQMLAKVTKFNDSHDRVIRHIDAMESKSKRRDYGEANKLWRNLAAAGCIIGGVVAIGVGVVLTLTGVGVIGGVPLKILGAAALFKAVAILSGGAILAAGSGYGLSKAGQKGMLKASDNVNNVFGKYERRLTVANNQNQPIQQPNI